jgi:hypothetical protein
MVIELKWCQCRLQAMAPPSHTATASTSTLCKLLTWHLAGTWQQAAAAGAQPYLMHQADWLAYLLHGGLDSNAQQMHTVLIVPSVVFLPVGWACHWHHLVPAAHYTATTATTAR